MIRIISFLSLLSAPFIFPALLWADNLCYCSSACGAENTCKFGTPAEGQSCPDFCGSPCDVAYGDYQSQCLGN